MSTIVPLEGFGGGGTSTNPELRIVGGTTRPAKPTQNMIWIDTDVEITEVILANKNPHSIESSNLYVAATSPGYIDSNGNIQSNSDWKVTEFIELPDGTQEVTITMSSNTSESPCHAFYDASKNLLSTVYRKPNTSIYAVPANAKYIRMSERLSEVVTLIASYTKDVPEGAVWITIGNSGNVKMASPVGGDWITVYPLSAKQYVDGALVDVTAKSYQGGAWVDWIIDLYNNGNECVALTGGWEVVAMPWSASVNNAKQHTLTKNATSMVAQANGIGGSAIRPNNAIDLTGFGKLKAKYSLTAGANDGFFRSLRVWNGGYLHASAVASANLTVGTNKEVEIDISGFSGLYDVGFCLYVANESATLTIDKVWME